MHIRASQNSDSEFLTKIHQASFTAGWTQNDFKQFMSKPDVYQIFVAEIYGDKIIGFVVVSCVGDEAEIITLCVSADYRQTGIGTALLNHLKIILSKQKIVIIHLEVSEDNQAAISLYKSFGFKDNGKRSAYSLRQDGTKSDAYMLKYFLP